MFSKLRLIKDLSVRAGDQVSSPKRVMRITRDLPEDCNVRIIVNPDDES